MFSESNHSSIGGVERRRDQFDSRNKTRFSVLRRVPLEVSRVPRIIVRLRPPWSELWRHCGRCSADWRHFSCPRSSCPPCWIDFSYRHCCCCCCCCCCCNSFEAAIAPFARQQAARRPSSASSLAQHSPPCNRRHIP